MEVSVRRYIYIYIYKNWAFSVLIDLCLSYVMQTSAYSSVKDTVDSSPTVCDKNEQNCERIMSSADAHRLIISFLCTFVLLCDDPFVLILGWFDCVVKILLLPAARKSKWTICNFLVFCNNWSWNVIRFSLHQSKISAQHNTIFINS